MSRFILLGAIGAIVSSTVISPEAVGGVNSIRASVKSEVVQTEDGVVVQTDVADESVPQTSLGPPITAFAQLDRLTSAGVLTGGGRAVSVFQVPNLLGFPAPNDVGMDIGAFGADEFTSWRAIGRFIETRFAVIGPGELPGAPLIPGTMVTLRSRVVVSGVLLIAAENQSLDLTGTEVNMQMSVTLRRPGAAEVSIPISGEVRLSGGPNGVFSVFAIGVFQNVSLPLLDLATPIAELPFVSALAFAGLSFDYVYDVAIGEEYELELLFGADVRTTPNGVAANAVFGLPQVQLPQILGRVKKDDRGERLAALISEQVDTTGRAYADRTGSAGAPVS
ncbi:MAG: hypothetical protein O7D94_09680, partial [Planctomycetota bacterium]|nr:hypothetical protein [Planctomycetota bacterium]